MGLRGQEKLATGAGVERVFFCSARRRVRRGIVWVALLLGMFTNDALSQETGGHEPAKPGLEGQALQSPIAEKSGGGLAVTDNVVQFPPMTSDAIDYFFDSLRAGSQFEPAPLRSSQQVPNNIAGIWAAARSSLESSISMITLRFRPSAEARLERAQAGANAPGLAESFDVELELKHRDFLIRHPLAANKSARSGLVVDLKEHRVTSVLIEFVKGYQDAGMYFAWPPANLSSTQKAWSLLICPRMPKFVQIKRNEDARLELHKSPYELREVNFSLSATTRARIPPTDRPERISVSMFASENLPRANLNKDEVTSLSPNLEVPYRPASPFDFFKIPPLVGHVQEGVLARIETENPAGHIRRQYHSHVVYVHRLEEPSPVSVIIGEQRAARDEGACYIVGVQRSTWNHYDRLPRNE
jgi:hypothetical protein